MRQKQGVFSLFLLSPSARRAWIEIFTSSERNFVVVVALREEGVDRNSDLNSCRKDTIGSPSARRAWIEISRAIALARSYPVALREEGVDRNSCRIVNHLFAAVALREEGVDRNVMMPVNMLRPCVALREEGVDRNF